MSRRNFDRARQDANMRRYGHEAINGSSSSRGSGSTDGERRQGPDSFEAVKKVRYAVTDVGVRFALEAAAQGFHVVYANDWSPGDKNLDRLEAAGVEVVICKGGK